MEFPAKMYILYKKVEMEQSDAILTLINRICTEKDCIEGSRSQFYLEQELIKNKSEKYLWLCSDLLSTHYGTIDSYEIDKR